MVSRCPVIRGYDRLENFVHDRVISEESRYKVESTWEFVKSGYSVVKDTAEFGTTIAKVANVSTVIADKVFAGISIPGILIDLIDRIKDFAAVCMADIADKWKKASRMTNSIMEFVGSGVDITKVVATFVMNSTLSVAAGFLSAIDIAIQVKELYNSVTFYKDLRSKDFDLSKVEEYDFNRRMDPSTSKIKQVSIPVKEVQQANKKRAIQKIVSHGLKMLAAAVNIVAAAILLAFPPLVVVSLGLVAFSSLISLSELILDKVVCYQWEKVIKKHTTHDVDI